MFLAPLLWLVVFLIFNCFVACLVFFGGGGEGEEEGSSSIFVSFLSRATKGEHIVTGKYYSPLSPPLTHTWQLTLFLL